MRSLMIFIETSVRAVVVAAALVLLIRSTGEEKSLLPTVYAQSPQAGCSHVYIEPGTTVLRDPSNGGQVQGKVVIDRRTGDVWGFPTASSAPYPVVLSRKEPPVSKPIYLGRFDFAAMQAR